MDITVAIPTYKRFDYVLEALQCVAEQKLSLSFEILILDNACDAELMSTVEKVAETAKVPVRYIPVSAVGLHNGRNLGALEANGEIIVYIDDDILAPPGWLEQLCAPFKDPSVGGVGGKIRPQWEQQPPDWLDTLPPHYFSLLDLGDDIHEIHWPEIPFGCNMAYRRDLVLTLGGFNPDGVGNQGIEWRRGDGETGFAQKVYQKHYRILYSGKAELYHRIPASRMTLAYARSRAMKGAISSFYAVARSHPHPRVMLTYLALKNFSRYLLTKIKKLIRSIRLPIQDWLPYELHAVSCGVTALYQLRLAVDPNLRTWVYQQDYWLTSSSSSVKIAKS